MTIVQMIRERQFCSCVTRPFTPNGTTVRDDLQSVHSELQSGCLRWLHYLALVSGLLRLQDGLLKPSVAAWDWLEAPPQTQWDCLMQAVEHDLESPVRLWDTFRFPSLKADTWRVLRHTLDDLSPARSYRVKDLFAMFKPYLLADKLWDIGYALRDLFAWSGVLLLARGRVLIRSQQFDADGSPGCPLGIH